MTTASMGEIVIGEASKRELLSMRALGKISPDQFLTRTFRGVNVGEKFFDEWLEKAREEESALDVQFGLALISSQNSRDVSVDILCRLLFCDWHFSHEDIAFLLYEMKDPQSVDCLFDAANLQLEYLEYDATFQLARKCIKGLASIASNGTIKRLKILGESPNPVISGYARKELNRKSK